MGISRRTLLTSIAITVLGLSGYIGEDGGQNAENTPIESGETTQRTASDTVTWNAAGKSTRSTAAEDTEATQYAAPEIKTSTETPTATEIRRPTTGTPPNSETTTSLSQQKTITIKSTGDERASYEFAVVGNITYGDNADPVKADFPDRINQTASDSIIEGEIVSGSVAEGGEDDYTFTGPIWDFAIDGPANVYVDGEQVDPDELYFSPPAATPTSPSTESLLTITQREQMTQTPSLTPSNMPSRTASPGRKGTPQSKNELTKPPDVTLTALILLFIIVVGTFGVLFVGVRWRT